MAETLKDIEGIDDVRLMVNTFYTRASTDELLSPVFTARMPQPIPDALYRYWENALLGNGGDDTIPFPKHADLPLTHQHFDRWLSIFHQTVDDLFSGPVAEAAKLRGIRMSEIFRFKMELVNF